MLPVSAKDVHQVVPDGDPESTTARKYALRTPTLRDKARIDREVLAAGAVGVSFNDMMDGLRNAVPTLLPEDERTPMLNEIDAFQAHVKEANESASKVSDIAPEVVAAADVATADPAAAAAEVPEEVQQQLATMLAVYRFELRVIEQVESYAKMKATKEYWWMIARTEAARQLLTGWDNVPMPCRAHGSDAQQQARGDAICTCDRGFAMWKGHDGLLTLEGLDQLPPLDVMAIGEKARELMAMGARQRGN